jgi:hypothetical protein
MCKRGGTLRPPMRMRAVAPTPAGIRGEREPNQYLEGWDETEMRFGLDAREWVLGGGENGSFVDHDGGGGGGGGGGLRRD